MANNFELIPVSLAKKLLGFSVNEALQQGIITSVGDEIGNFVFTDAEQTDIYYAIINSYLIRCSENVVNSGLDIASIAGGLVFFKYLLNGQEAYKLGMPNNVKLGYVVSQIKKGE